MQAWAAGGGSDDHRQGESAATCDGMSKQAYSEMSTPTMKPVEWVGSARDDLCDVPEAVQHDFGYALYQAQIGKHHSGAKRLKGEFAGLVELVEDDDGNTYRAIYTVKLARVVYVLHVFQKKSTHGIGMPRHAIATIRARWQQAQQHYAKHYAATRRI